MSGVGFGVSISSRVSAIEAHDQDKTTHDQQVDEKLDKLLEGLARVEGQLSKGR